MTSLADVGRLTEMTIRAGMTVMRTVTQYKERQMAGNRRV